MPEYRHPRALDSVAGHPPAAVTLAGSNVAVDDSGRFESGAEQAVARLAESYGVDVATLRVGDDSAAESAESDDVCTVELSGGGTCGRDRPCPYHDQRSED